MISVVSSNLFQAYPRNRSVLVKDSRACDLNGSDGADCLGLIRDVAVAGVADGLCS